MYGHKLFLKLSEQPISNFIACFKSSIINFIFSAGVKQIEANPDAKRLYDDLLSNYNRLIRPVQNNSETLTVWLGLKLSQLIEMNLKNQIMTTNLWVVQVRTVRKLLHLYYLL